MCVECKNFNLYGFNFIYFSLLFDADAYYIQKRKCGQEQWF